MPSGVLESGRLHIYYVWCTSSKARHNSAQFRNSSPLFRHFHALHPCFLGALYIVSHLPFDEESKSSTLSSSSSSSCCWVMHLQYQSATAPLIPAFSTRLPLFCSMQKAGFTTLVHAPFSLFTAKQLRMQMGDWSDGKEHQWFISPYQHHQEKYTRFSLVFLCLKKVKTS